MIVDDMELNRDLLSEILEEEYTILTAENGKQAMDALVEKHDEIALMLLDLVMPEMDGFAVLTWGLRISFISRLTIDWFEGESVTWWVCSRPKKNWNRRWKNFHSGCHFAETGKTYGRRI